MPNYCKSKKRKETPKTERPKRDASRPANAIEPRYLTYYRDDPGETLTLWHKPEGVWRRETLRYDEIVSFSTEGIFLELILKQGGAFIAGWNLPTLEVLLRKRAVRAVRAVSQGDPVRLYDPEYADETGVLSRHIWPAEIVVSRTGAVFAPPESVPNHATVH